MLLSLCGVFYAGLCFFSLVVGIMYMTGNRELPTVELSDSFVKRLESAGRLGSFAKLMGLVTFIVGIVQGACAYAILKGKGPGAWWFALGFTLFSLASVALKLRGKISAFPLAKAVTYSAILVTLLLGSTRALFLV